MSEEADDDNADDRISELLTISAIYPELQLSEKYSASLEVPVTPLEPVPVIFPQLSSSAPPGVLTPPGSDTSTSVDEGIKAVSEPETEVRRLSHLPPLLLNIHLPDAYPQNAPPNIDIQSQPSWLPPQKLQELKDAASTLWEDMGRDQTVFVYIDHIQQAAEDCFGLVSSGASLRLPPDLEVALLDYDLQTKRAKFEQETFECGVCLEPKKGKVCHRLTLCGHVFCVPCLQDFYNNCITEGDITNVKCLAPGCGKESQKKEDVEGVTRRRRRKPDRTLEPSELLQIPLEQDVVHRYIKMKRKKKLESNKYTIYCPRKWCQGPARTTSSTDADDDESDNETNAVDKPKHKQFDPNDPQSAFPPPSERLAVCLDCCFAFCCVCQTGWHGEFANCFPRRTYELDAEEKATKAYLEQHSSPCPTCDARCQKTMGCNHMICYQCETHFCYLCSSWLNDSNPYAHFNTVGTECFQRLWELEEGDGAGAPVIQRGHALPPPPGGVAAPPPGANPPQPGVPVQLPPVEIIFEDDEAAVPPPAPVPPPQQGRYQNGVRVNVRAQRGLAPAVPIVQLRPRHGLQRFLDMAANDQEDGWDSDELDDMDGWDEIN